MLSPGDDRRMTALRPGIGRSNHFYQSHHRRHSRRPWQLLNPKTPPLALGFGVMQSQRQRNYHTRLPAEPGVFASLTACPQASSPRQSMRLSCFYVLQASMLLRMRYASGFASISACSANATICAHRQRRTSCEKSAASKLKRCKRLLQALLQAVRVPSHPALVLLRAPVPARQTSASLPLAGSFSTCGKNAACNKKAVQQEIIFHGVVFLRRVLLCQCWRGLRAPRPFRSARKVSYLT